MIKLVVLSVMMYLGAYASILGQNGDIKTGKNNHICTDILHINKTNDRLSEPKKWVAVTLNVTLGMFGVHRLYLGTSPQVPVIYTFTLGGGGIIIIGDLIAILSAKDLEKYAANPKVIMWGGEE
jgi:hypothetical protein